FFSQTQPLLRKLGALLDTQLSPLPKKQQAAFDKQLRAKVALLRTVSKGGGVIRIAAHKTKAAPAPATIVPAPNDIQSRLEHIIDRGAPTRTMEEEAWDIVFSPPPLDKTRRELEDRSLALLFRSVEDKDTADWEACVPHAAALHALSFQDRQDVHGDDIGRLVLLNNRILARQGALNVNSFNSRLYITIDNIEFGMRWSAIGNTKGGRSIEKEKFCHSAYLSQHRSLDLANIANDPAFAKWKKNVMQPIVAGRYKLVNVFRAFGLLVLIDPFWDARTLNSNCRTKNSLPSSQRSESMPAASAHRTMQQYSSSWPSSTKTFRPHQQALGSRA
ncbi:hypothetical protein BD626DRAFT_412403, partial [Schizophyllum amplum]